MKLFLRLIHWMYVENSERPGCHPLCLQEFYNCKYDPKNPEFWKQIELANGALFWLAWGWKIKKLFWKKVHQDFLPTNSCKKLACKLVTGPENFDVPCSVPALGCPFCIPKNKYHHTPVDDWNAAPVDMVVLSHYSTQGADEIYVCIGVKVRGEVSGEKEKPHVFFKEQQRQRKDR